MGTLHINSHTLASLSISHNFNYHTNNTCKIIKPSKHITYSRGRIRATGTMPETATESDEPPSVWFAFVSSVLLPDGTPDIHRRTACGGQKLRDIMLDSNIELYGPYSRPLLNCAGGGTCATCMVEAYSSPDMDNFSENVEEGSKEGNQSHEGKWFTSNETLNKLRRYGIAGILSYGLLNTAYYLTTFLIVWFYVAPAPGKMGYLAAAERFLKVMAMVWAGSQVTKLLRAGGALALAPIVDRGLSWFTVKFNFESRGKAFATIVGFCLGLALLLFLVVTLVSA